MSPSPARMAVVPPLPFDEARRTVIGKVRELRAMPRSETVHLGDAAGRVLASPVTADRDYPPTARSVRDGFAVRAADLPGTLTVIGEVRAGGSFAGTVNPGQAVEIMTGAPMPDGADSVVMVEHTTTDGDQVAIGRTLEAGENVNGRGSECRAGDVVLDAGHALTFTQIALLAAVGAWNVPVYARPRVAIIATGDELVEEGVAPLPHQIRNSNSYSLAAQVKAAGGEPFVLPVARDTLDETLEVVAVGLKADLLLLSGGVSAGKYDVVEHALAQFGAEFYFDRVLIQPGQPLVFGRAQGAFFFGLPGNPASTMVCFEVFARAALDLLAGRSDAPLPMLDAVVAAEFRVRPGLTRVLPALLSSDGRGVKLVRWTGSSDLTAVARANCFLVTDPERGHYTQGERIRVLRANS